MGAPSVDRIRALHFAPCSRSPLVEVLVVVEALIKFAPSPDTAHDQMDIAVSAGTTQGIRTKCPFAAVHESESGTERKSVRAAGAGPQLSGKR